MIYIYLLSVIFICSVLYLTFDVYFSDTKRFHKMPFVYFCILSIIMFLIAFTVVSHKDDSMTVYNMHIIYLSLLPFLPLCLLIFSINLQEDNLSSNKNVKYIFSIIAILLSLSIFIMAPRAVPANFNGFTFIYDVYSQKHIFFIFSLYYFTVAVVNVIYFYRLIKLPMYSKFIPPVIIAVSTYNIYLFFIQFLYHDAQNISLVYSSFFVNIIPVVSIFLSIRLLSTYGKNFNEISIKAIEISDEATCIVYNNVIKFANKKFHTLFFNNENFDISNPDTIKMLPSEFFDTNIYNSKIISFTPSYKEDSVDLIINKIKSSQNEFFITIFDVSFAKVQKEEADYLEENIMNIVYERQEMKQLLSKNDKLEAETKELIDTQNKKILLETTDPLTGLKNRRFFNQLTHNILLASDPTKDNHLMIYLDLDNFKTVNDTLGHLIGDNILRHVADMLMLSVPENSVISRIGGDEFLIFIKHDEKMGSYSAIIEDVSDKILNNIKRPITIDNNVINISISMGFSVFPMGGGDVETLIKNADIALYQAKESGKSRYGVFEEEEKNRQIKEEFNLTNDMISALENDNFEIYYQPQLKIVDDDTHEIIGFEAFIRWLHPTRGYISPALFLPIAERSGYINKLSLWILDNICHQIVKWNEIGFNPNLSINFAAPSFEKDYVYNTTIALLQNLNIDLNTIQFEISEKYLAKNISTTIETLAEIKKVNVKIAIDNFGTDYSSLNYLKYIPVDVIKLDLSFINGIGKNQKDEAIIIALIKLCQYTGIDIIAEGVETKAQYDFLMSHGLRKMQGYYFYKSMPADDITNLAKSINLIKS